MSCTSISSPKLSSVSGLSSPMLLFIDCDSFLYFYICSYYCFFEKLGFTFVKSRKGMFGLNLWLEVWVLRTLFMMLALFSFYDRLRNIRPMDWFVVEAALYTEMLFETCWALFWLQASFVISLTFMAPEETTLITELVPFYIYLIYSSKYFIFSFFSFNYFENVLV